LNAIVSNTKRVPSPSSSGEKFGVFDGAKAL
jgi:hypothetical protein